MDDRCISYFDSHPHLELSRFSSHRELYRPDPSRVSKRVNYRDRQEGSPRRQSDVQESSRRQGGCGRCHVAGASQHHHHHHQRDVVNNPAFHY